MKKRVLSLLLCLVLAATLLPTTALAATRYDLRVGGIQVTSDNASDLAAASDKITGKVSYNAATNTLTMENATITGVPTELYGAAIDLEHSLTIYLIGTNTINAAVQDNGNSVAIFAIASDLTITGPGSLTVRSGPGFKKTHSHIAKAS